jgi:hypothetical protein
MKPTAAVRKAVGRNMDIGLERTKLLLEMADLLEVMDIWEDDAAQKAAGIAADDRSKEACRQICEEKEKAKDRFFFLFNQYFYDFWY